MLEIPPKLLDESLHRDFGKLPADVQFGVIEILRYRKVNGLEDDSEERVGMALKYQEFLKTRKVKPLVTKPEEIR